MSKGRFIKGDRVIVNREGNRYFGKRGFIYGAYHFLDHSEYHVKVDGDHSLFTAEFQDEDLKPEQSELASARRGETYMLPNGELVDPNKVFVKDRGGKPVGKRDDT